MRDVYSQPLDRYSHLGYHPRFRPKYPFQGSEALNLMPRVCHFTGARTTTGRKIHYRGRPKYQGGIGLKPSGIARRTFKPNIQTVRAVIDGKARRIKATAKSIRNGLVVKPLRRKYGWTRKLKQQQGEG